MLQTVWLSWSEDLERALSLPRGCGTAPVLLREEHLTMTLGALRVRDGDTLYFRAAVSIARSRFFAVILISSFIIASIK